MRQIRHYVFETNSSSTHSITITHKGIANNNIPVGRDGFIHTELGEFGWEIEDYNDQAGRLSYLVTMLAVKSQIEMWRYGDKRAIVKELMELHEFEKLSDKIGRHARCKGVIVDPSEGYIDHQSHEGYRNFQDFLAQYDTDVVEFVFGRGNIVHTDNDNY